MISQRVFLLNKHWKTISAMVSKKKDELMIWIITNDAFVFHFFDRRRFAYNHKTNNYANGKRVGAHIWLEAIIFFSSVLGME